MTVQDDPLWARSKVRLASWNVGGLATFHRRIGVKAFVRKFRPHILALQETHISADRLDFLVSTFSSEYTVLASDSRGHSGGVAFLVHNSCVIHDWKALDFRRIWAIIEVNKTVSFFIFKQVFGLHDIRRIGCEQKWPKFTRVQNRQGKMIWSTLDRFYSPLSLLGNFQVHLIHHPEFLLSDHLPVSLWFFAGNRSAAPQPKSLFFKVDPRVQENQDLKEKLEAAWKSNRGEGKSASPEGYFRAWKEIRAIVKDAQYQESLQLSQLDQKRKRLKQLADLATDGDDHSAEFLSLNEEVRKLQVIQDHKLRLWSREKFLLMGETNSSYFLKKFKRKCFQTSIKSLKLDDGTTVTSQNDIIREVFNFFSQVYAKPPEDCQVLRDRDDLLNALKPVISTAENAFLSEPPSHREFSDILRLLPRGRAPGIDGFSHDALRELWWLIGEDYSSMMQSCWISGSFPASMLEGVIKLIPKDLRPESLHHWRPIALLTAHYKLLTKVIAVRLALILPKIVPPQQQGFIKGRGVHGCILNLLLAHESLKKHKRNAAFVMLDLEKAYDRLSLEFLWEVLRRMDFGSHFISVLQGLTHGAVARVQVNHSLSPDFPILRRVRQGCPLAPLLFALASVPFILRIHSAATTGAIKAVQLPGDLTLDVIALADDTAIFLALHEPTFHIFFQILGQFQSASGAKVNLKKSKIMLVVASRIHSLYDRHLSFEGRSVLLRFLVQSKLSFAMSLVLLRNSQLKTIKQLFRSLLWGLSKEGAPKTPLVGWDFLTAPTSAGGLGIWDLQRFNMAFLTKYTDSLLLNPPDATWPPLFWNLCRDSYRRPPLENSTRGGRPSLSPPVAGLSPLRPAFAVTVGRSYAALSAPFIHKRNAVLTWKNFCTLLLSARLGNDYGTFSLALVTSSVLLFLAFGLVPLFLCSSGNWLTYPCLLVFPVALYLFKLSELAGDGAVEFFSRGRLDNSPVVLFSSLLRKYFSLRQNALPTKGGWRYSRQSNLL
ncbi:hypothetical protein R1sor_019507 [Riccia sorocarpa]|uniref:Reverse transcriptase domain-containing protein n=1 Tax=Riccia sorocarpa TaxID=122646 RepID=A0ABD3IGC3_9MARC